MNGGPPAGGLRWLDDIDAGDRAAVGGKAYVLAVLRQAGLPVPNGFVVPPSFRDHDALARACASLGGPFAVRSSAASEDGAEASFAGQFRTELDVAGAEAVRAAVDRCRAPTGAARDYAQAMGTEPGDALAVLVQRFVEPVAAGVTFTRHPMDPSAMLVEAHAGRGDALVSGLVSPDRYTIDRATSAVRDGAGGCLGPADVAAVGALAVRAEEHLGAPQDVEWAIGPEGPVLLQARPMTVAAEAPPDPRVRRLTRANVGEVLPGPVSPLTASSVLAFLEHGFRVVARDAGVLPEGSPPFLVVHEQYLYLNLTLCREIVARLPGVSTAEAERLVFGGGAPAIAPAVSGRWRALIGVAGRLAGLSRGLPARVEAAERALDLIEQEGRRATHAPLAAWDRLIELGRPVAVTHILATGSSAVKLSILSRLLRAMAPGDPADRVNRLTAGLDHVESAAPTVALEELAAESVQHPDWKEWLGGGPADVRGAPPALAARLQSFLARFGHRGISEGELATRTWADDPAPVLASLASLARRQGIARAAATERRRADEAALLSAAGLAGGGLLRRAIAEAQAGVRRREHTKSLAVRFIARARRLARETGTALAAEGRLARADDVFFLTLPELRAAVGGTMMPAPEIARRRRRHARAGAYAVPREVDLAGPPIGPAAEGGALTGIAVSAGVGVGPARVLRPGEPPAIAAGEVLVAPVLDAAYGPLLASAAAAVAEMGGLLSHGAVVARELGVPCVVDVRDATRRIRPGQTVRVNGGSGLVEVLDPAAPAGDRAAPELVAADEADEIFHPLEDHPLARESVYFNVHDPAEGLALVVSAGVRRGGRGEALLAITRRPGEVLFGVALAPSRGLPAKVAVGDLHVALSPPWISFMGRLASYRGPFPPGPIPLLMTPPDVEVLVDLRFTPVGPAIDFCHGLPDDVRAALTPLGAHHIEQSGTWTGIVVVDDRSSNQQIPIRGTGSRDHTWGRRDWSGADWWRLFTMRLGDDVAVHALVVSARGRVVEGGFVWRDGRTERIVRVQFAPRRERDALRALELEVITADGETLRIHGEVERSITVPVDLDRRLHRHLSGRPWRLLLDENFTRYEGLGRRGHGMAEITRR
jgi:phosphohistidine swiveling domain-containing protein